MDIIVFPEGGLVGVRNAAVPTLVPSADEQVTPCTAPESATSKTLRELSCLAAAHEMYLAVNLNEKFPCKAGQDKDCRSEGFFHYNTEVVFDRTGKIVARWVYLEKTKSHSHNFK